MAYQRHVIARVRKLRKRQTPAEKILWSRLRNRGLEGKKFLRQHPIFYKRDDKESFYVADFYCHELRLVVEVDGIIHDFQRAADALRTKTLLQKGYRVVRFRNDAIETDVNDVLRTLVQEISMFSTPFSSQEKRAGG